MPLLPYYSHMKFQKSVSNNILLIRPVAGLLMIVKKSGIGKAQFHLILYAKQWCDLEKKLCNLKHECDLEQKKYCGLLNKRHH